jgi:hypothetical protein
MSTATDTPKQEPDQAPQAAAQSSVSPNAMVRSATGGVVRVDQANEQDGEPTNSVELPDGTFVKALNGATDAPSMEDFWGPFDWSPIVGIESNSAGLDWYKHADGSYSTTQMVMRPDLGRMASMTRVAHPGPTPANTAPQSRK